MTNSRSWHAKSRKTTKNKGKRGRDGGSSSMVVGWEEGVGELLWLLESCDLDDQVFNGFWVPSKNPTPANTPSTPKLLVRRDPEKGLWPEETTTRQTTWCGGQCPCCWGQVELAVNWSCRNVSFLAHTCASTRVYVCVCQKERGGNDKKGQHNLKNYCERTPNAKLVVKVGEKID